MRSLLKQQAGIDGFLPDGYCASDPRDGEATLFNPRRAVRPSDNSPAHTGAACVVCDGETTPIIDIAPLRTGFTFINENLYPIVSPFAGTEAEPRPKSGSSDKSKLTEPARGLHFLQWTSNFHDCDWPELGSQDRTVVLARLASLERRLYNLPDCPLDRDDRYVSIIKNAGRLVGGSLSHGHQQIVLSNVMPRRVRENRAFNERMRQTFASYMLEQNPDELTVLELDWGKLVIPYYMRRPYDMLFLLSDSSKDHLFELSSPELGDIGTALATGMRLMEHGLFLLHRETAYNVVFHTGPGVGLYMEFLPRSQENGGFEQLGLSACQASPVDVARQLRAAV